MSKCNGNCNQGRQCDCYDDELCEDKFTFYLAYIIVIGIMTFSAILFGVAFYHIIILFQ